MGDERGRDSEQISGPVLLSGLLSISKQLERVANGLQLDKRLGRIEKKLDQVLHQQDELDRRAFDRHRLELGALDHITGLLERTGGQRSDRTTIHVVAVEGKPQEDVIMDQMPPIRLPATTVRAKLSVVNPRKADGSRVESVTWSTSNETDLPLEAIADSTVQILDPNWVDPGDGSTAPLIDAVDPADGQPLKVFSTYANTPRTQEEIDQLPNQVAVGVVTVSAEGMHDASIEISYADPAKGHFAIVAVEAAE